MAQDIEYESRGAHDASRGDGGSYAGSRIRALADSSGRGWRDAADARRPGVRTHEKRRHGRDFASVAHLTDGWLGGRLQRLGAGPLRGIGAATAAGVIVGLIVFTILNRRR